MRNLLPQHSRKLLRVGKKEFLIVVKGRVGSCRAATKLQGDLINNFDAQTYLNGFALFNIPKLEFSMGRLHDKAAGVNWKCRIIGGFCVTVSACHHVERTSGDLILGETLWVFRG